MAGSRLEMPENWRHIQIQILCLGSHNPRASKIYWPNHDEWQAWAVGVHRGAVEKANTLRARGPMLVCSWLAMRAKTYSWDDLFQLWAQKAHGAGDLKNEAMDSPLFTRLSETLVLEERLCIAWKRFHAEYEKAFGYPVRCSPLANASYDERELAAAERRAAKQ